MDLAAPLLTVEGLAVHFASPRAAFGPAPSPIRAVDGVSFTLARSRTLGLVGESGCGKSTTGYAILQLIRPTAGRVVFDGTDIAALPANKLRPFRRRMQMIFQDSAASLHPRMPIGDLITEALDIHGLHRGAGRGRRIRQLLDLVAIASHLADRFPHGLSAGQAHRIAISQVRAPHPQPSS